MQLAWSGHMARTGLLAIKLACCLAFVSLALAVLPLGLDIASADAPGLATVRYEAPLLDGPDASAGIVVMVREGTDVELTGNNRIGYLQVTTDGQTGWMSTNALTITGASPVSTAIAPGGTAIYDAPLDDAGVLGSVPADGVVILTGAHVGAYVAGSYDGVGGWILESDLDVPYDDDSTAR